MINKENKAVATFGAGCFWCVEAVFQNLKGVEKVVSGYMGGHVDNPTYNEICTGMTGHAEIIQIHFDQNIINFETLCKIFFTTHDPTTLDRQGNDRGTQYRSAVFYHDEEQRVVAERIKKEYAPTLWDNPIVTEITPLDVFYEAEQYHQNYYNNNSSQSYCMFVVNPKVRKVRQHFAELLK
ncbi:MAG: peptide-methionine (S)-S-oxide reductase [Saprospiraceae bacterium]|jgi:peptide-methionine (S)-S-oxide reductase